MEFLEKVKEDLRPDDSVLEKTRGFISEINKRIKFQKIKASCVEGGSVAKGTFLKDDFDVDLFVKFDYSYNDKDISGMLEGILKGYIPDRLHGSRDYFQIKKDSLNYEIVPVLDVKDPERALNVTDMSPMHVDWVKKNIKKGQEDDIRLAKKFCKVIGAYGAESYIRGFSGHVIDILVIHYKGFINLLKESAKWKAPVVVDTERHYKNKMDILFSINRSKIEGPMIVVDPLLKSRNAASALSYEKFALFKKKAAAFLKKPEIKYFIPEETGKAHLKKKFKSIYIITLEAKEGKKDVVGSSILRAFTLMKAGLEKKGFKIKQSGWEWNNKKHVLFWFVFKDSLLPQTKIMQGPPLSMEEHAKVFRKKYRDCKIRANKLYASVKNEFRKPKDAIEAISCEDYIKSRLKLKEIEKYK